MGMLGGGAAVGNRRDCFIAGMMSGWEEGRRGVGGGLERRVAFMKRCAFK